MERKLTDDQVYPACWITLGLLLALLLAWCFPLGQPPLPACWFFTRWHLYCPGCGGTRAVEALLRGRWLLALYYHPAVPFTALSVGAYLLTQTVWRLRGKRGFALHYRERWLWCLLALLAVNCLARNALWFGLGVPIS